MNPLFEVKFFGSIFLTACILRLVFLSQSSPKLLENFSSLYTAYSRSIQRLRIQPLHTKFELFHVSTLAKTMGSVFPDGRMGGSCFRYLFKFKLVKKNCIFCCQVFNPFPPNLLDIYAFSIMH